MEQTVNTFQKGMQLDTNPMLTGNDILTDALNATVVTMNGNELVLQNDMGNRKVNLAFLPDGYQPVGVKEYGGIIYVASYNPLTNKGQLGSFPSPRRYMGDYYQKDGILSIDETNLHESKSGIQLYPLTSSDFNIHTGDKFILYGNLPVDYKKLSNYNNYNSYGDKKIDTPKNKLYTLSVGILNSQHEFVDITKSLIRWNRNNDNTGLDKLESTGSELKDFNNGYFIKKSFNPDGEITSLANQELNQTRDIARNVLDANTYSYKLTGPLYLKVQQNRVQSVNYTITGEQTLGADSKLAGAKLDIIGYLTYNCPDIFSNGNNSDLYSDLKEGTRINDENKTWFKLTNSIGTFKTKSYTGTDLSFTKYDETTDLYHAVVVNNVNIKKENLPEDNIWNYTLKIPTEVDGNNYIESLTVTGSIDLSLLNSGKVNITGFRFTNDFTNKRGTVTFNIQAYPKIGQKFTNLQFIIKTKRKEKITWDSEWNPTGGGWEAYDKIINIIPEFASGQYTVNFDWGLYLVDQQVFQAELKYTDSTKTDPVAIKGFWYITTELCNKCYSLSSDYYISDYRDFIKEDKTDIVKEILTVNYDTTADVEDVSFYDEQNKVSGTLISKEPGDISIKNESIYHIRLLANCYGTIMNPQLYPTELLDNIGNVSLTIHSVTDKINTPNSDTVQIETVKTGIKQFTNNLTELGNVSKQLIDNNVNVINNTITFRDLYESTSIQKSITITNGFVPVKEGLTKLTEECKPGGIILFTNQRGGGKSNNHYFLFPNKSGHPHRTRLSNYVIKDAVEESWTNRNEGDILEHGSDEEFYLMKKENRDGEISTNFNYLSAEFFDQLNKLPNTTFAWCFTSEGGNSTIYLDDGSLSLNNISSNNKIILTPGNKIKLYDEGLTGQILSDIMARVWWKTNNNETWALLEFPFSTNNLFKYTVDTTTKPNWPSQPDTTYHYSRINNLYNNINSISDFLALFFPENLYFCLYKNYQGQYYMPYTNNEIYNKPYTLNYTCNIIHGEKPTQTKGVKYYGDNTDSLLIFTQSEIPAGQISYETSVKSNEEFIDNILDSRSNSEFSNIALDTLQREDINGQSLVYNTLYEKNSDGKLVISQFNKAVVSDMGQYNTLLFNKSNAKKESLNWFRNEMVRDDTDNNSDSTTKLEYSDLYIAHVI